MTPAAWVLLAAAALVAGLDWWAVTVGNRPVEYGAKPAATALLVGVALALDPIHGDAQAWFVLALVFSLAGDVFLMLPRERFLTGVASFLVAHVAYIVGLNLHSRGEPAPVVTTILVVVGAGWMTRRLVTRASRDTVRRLGVAVGVYIAVITTMGASALASGSVLAAVGAVLFMVSDALIAETRFVRPRPWGRPAIMVTYHVGQALLVCSLVA